MPQGTTQLINLVSKGIKEDVQELINRGGCDVNEIDNEGHTAIMEAVQNNYIEITRILLAANIDVNIDEDGHTPLMEAVEQNYTEMTKILIAAKADLNIKENGRTPVEVATEYKYSEMVTILNAANKNPANSNTSAKPSQEKEAPLNEKSSQNRPPPSLR